MEFYEQQSVINAVQYERHEWLKQHQTDIQPPPPSHEEFRDHCCTGFSDSCLDRV